MQVSSVLRLLMGVLDTPMSENKRNFVTALTLFAFKMREIVMKFIHVFCGAGLVKQLEELRRSNQESNSSSLKKNDMLTITTTNNNSNTSNNNNICIKYKNLNGLKREEEQHSFEVSLILCSG